MSPRIREDYYIKQKDKLMTQFDKVLGISRDLFAKKIKKERIDTLMEEMRKEYGKLIPQIPYIGGKRNSFTLILIDSILMLPIYKILEKEGLTYMEIGEYNYEFYEKIQEIRKKKLETSGQNPSERYFQEDYKNYLKIFAKNLQKKVYPDDWVMEFVDGEGKDFDFGLNISECGVVKFFRKLRAEKFVPFICLSDYAEGQVSVFGFERTQTIGNGDPICNHRFIKNGITPRAWPPYHLQEYKIDNQGNFKNKI